MKRNYFAILGILALGTIILAQDKQQTLVPMTITSEVKTNVLSGDNSSGCTSYQEGVIPAVLGHICRPYVPPTKKWTITSVVRVTEFSFNWFEKPFTIKDETVISSTTNVMVLKSEWTESKEPIPEMAPLVVPSLLNYWIATNEVTMWITNSQVPGIRNSQYGGF